MPATAPAEAEKSVSSSSAVPLGHRTYLTLLDELGSFYVNGKKVRSNFRTFAPMFSAHAQYLFCKYGLTGANDDREREGPVPKKLYVPAALARAPPCGISLPATHADHQKA